MAGQYQFVVKETKEPKVLAEVDNEICKFFEKDPDPVEFSREYSRIVTTGICASLQTGIVTPESLQEYFDFCAEKDPVKPSHQEILREFLINRYQFVTWRSLG